jgi:hypothetical protein
MEVPPDIGELSRNASLLEWEGIKAYQGFAAQPSGRAPREKARQDFDQALSCLMLLSESIDVAGHTAPEEVEETLGAGWDLPFRLAVCGLLAQRTAEIRLHLRDLVVTNVARQSVRPNISTPRGGEDWRSRLIADIFGAFVLLTRKDGAWQDIEIAMSRLAALRETQQQMEPGFLATAQAVGRGAQAAGELVGLFHLAQMVTLVGRYLTSGQTLESALTTRLDRHHDQAKAAFEEFGLPTVGHTADMLWAGCRELVHNALWSHVQGLGEKVSEFARQLASSDQANPVIELWPSQQEALSRNLLDQYRRAIIVEMPTSAGKTLLAEFVIIQSLTLLPSSTVAYVVPTRALVNQVSRDLRAHLRPLGLRVEQAVPAFDIDPAELALLEDAPNVLVTTPEKLSLLLRRDHPSLANLALVIVDEAHALADGARGARLELLLATIKRDRPAARYLLLSPFLPKAEELVEWLGDDRGLPPIMVNWRPGRRVVGALHVTGRASRREVVLETLDAADNTDLPSGTSIVLGPAGQRGSTIKAVSRLSAAALRRRGTTLIVCWGPRSAMDRADEIAAECELLPADPLREAVGRFVQAELGSDSPLANHIARGVAYHHSGMPLEARALIECLVRRGLLHTVCATTTLAQGVNFPISNVLVEDRRKGSQDKLSHSDLWNIAGRAGRTLLDTVGLVAFPVTKNQQHQEWQEFLRRQAGEVASQLSDLIDKADALQRTLGLKEIRELPGLTDLLQFLAHAMRVSGATQTAAELEDLLRNSLVYQQARRQDVTRSDALVRLCRSYLTRVSSRPGEVALSDQTGFSTFSVGLLLGEGRQDPDLRDPTGWRPDVLFGQDHQPLADRLKVLGNIPELSLGSEERGNFSSRRAAEILQRWVSGESIASLGLRFGKGANPQAKVADFGRYLLRDLSYNASWGLGAMEAAYLSAFKDADPASRYVPSMVYFGVGSPEAVWMRMAGLPRAAAPEAGARWLQDHEGPPTSHDQVRQWAANLTQSDWDNIVASHAPLTGRDMRQVWNEALA